MEYQNIEAGNPFPLFHYDSDYELQIAALSHYHPHGSTSRSVTCDVSCVTQFRPAILRAFEFAKMTSLATRAFLILINSH